jgi:hypothetical protein
MSAANDPSSGEASRAGPPPVDTPGFTSDLTDGRAPLQWRSRYEDRPAHRRMAYEAAYLGALLVIAPCSLAWIYLGYPQRLLNLSGPTDIVMTRYALVYVGGVLGGTLYTTKWLYHAIAHGWWNIDRTIWRIFSPLLSGGLAFAVVLLIAARVFPVLGSDVVGHDAGALAVSIFVGYFSDKAARWLAMLAERMFKVTDDKIPTDAGTE